MNIKTISNELAAKNSNMRITMHCKVKFAINVDFVNEVECDVATLKACDVIFGSAYLWDKCDRDALFYIRENQYRLVKGGVT
jgi:hypothetical protein